jgi:hypothetical protein
MGIVKFGGEVDAEDIAYDMGLIMGGCEEIRKILESIRIPLISSAEIPNKVMTKEVNNIMSILTRIEQRAEVTRNTIDEEI